MPGRTAAGEQEKQEKEEGRRLAAGKMQGQSAVPEKRMSVNLYLYPGMEKNGGEERMRACARHFCGGAGQERFERIARTPKGKPYFPDAPEVACSVSHTEGYWACAISDGPVGLDVEKMRPCPAEQIARRFFHPQEALFAAQSQEAFFQVWTAKESYVKLLGRGIDASFGDVSVVEQGRLIQRLGEVEFLPIALGPEYCMCLCGKRIQMVQCVAEGEDIQLLKNAGQGSAGGWKEEGHERI